MMKLEDEYNRFSSVTQILPSQIENQGARMYGSVG